MRDHSNVVGVASSTSLLRSRQINALADRFGVSRAMLVRYAIERYLLSQGVDLGDQPPEVLGGDRKTITVNIPALLFEELQTLAAEAGVSQRELVEDGIEAVIGFGSKDAIREHFEDQDAFIAQLEKRCAQLEGSPCPRCKGTGVEGEDGKLFDSIERTRGAKAALDEVVAGSSPQLETDAPAAEAPTRQREAAPATAGAGQRRVAGATKTGVPWIDDGYKPEKKIRQDPPRFKEFVG